MEEFVQYDVKRLQSFMNNPLVEDVIKVVDRQNLISLKFPYINYFNYSIGTLENESSLHDLIDFYRNTNSKRFKFIVDSEQNKTCNLIDRTGRFRLKNKIAKKIMCRSGTHRAYHSSGVNYESVDTTNLDLFIGIYMKCFRGENWHPDSLHENFRQKMLIPGNQFYIIYFKEEPVGVCGLYMAKAFTFFSVGGVLPEYQGRGFHKSALSFRISKSFEQAPENKICVWAYKGSISHANLIKVGMSLQKEYFEYEFVG